MANHRVVLDTNVLISAILFGGKPRLILNDVIAGRVDCIPSSEILDGWSNAEFWLRRQTTCNLAQARNIVVTM